MTLHLLKKWFPLLQKTAEWNAIAATLSEAFSTPEMKVEVKGRGCRERMERLIEKHKKKDSVALKRYTCTSNMTEARGEIQNFVRNFLENLLQDGSGHYQSEMEPDELNVVEVVKEEHIASALVGNAFVFGHLLKTVV